MFALGHSRTARSAIAMLAYNVCLDHKRRAEPSGWLQVRFRRQQFAAVAGVQFSRRAWQR
jgi:hypothetical protein